jgi:fucose 4-O-acetylase-like acetyltransferase
LVSIVLIVILFRVNPPHQVFYLATGFRALGGSQIFEMAIRSTILLTASTSTLFLMATLTSKATFFSRWGVASLSIYLLHGFWVMALSHWIKVATWKMPPPFVMLSAGALGIGISALCSLSPFERAIRSLPRRLVSGIT